MEKTCQITLSKTHVNEAFNFNLTEDYHNMEFCLELEDQLRFKSYLIVTDPRNRIRLQRLVSHGELRYIIGNSPENTSVGGNPGPIPKGVWKCGFYCIYGNFDELFEKPCTIMLRIRCNAAEAAPDVIGNDRWTDYDKEINQLSLNNYDETQLYSDKSKWYAGDFH